MIALPTSEIGDDPDWARQLAHQAVGEAMDYGKRWPDDKGWDEDESNANLFLFAVGNYLQVLRNLGQEEEAASFAQAMGIVDDDEL